MRGIQPSVESNAAKANKDVIHRLTDKFLNQGQGEVLNALYTADAIHHTPLGDLNVKGRQEMRLVLGTALPDFKVVIVSLTANDEWVSALYQFSSTFTGTLPMPDGKVVSGNNAPINMPLGTFYRLNERAQIIESWELYDNLSFSMMMGLIPAPMK